MMTLNVLAVTVIVLWAFWCLLSPRVSDGIVGKVLYMLLVLAALGVLSHPGERAETILNCTFAAIGIRHFWMKTVFCHLRATVLKRIRCATCPHSPKEQTK
jgi:hypothetical protein